jgi:tetratricopeptide (TPR) repeat protein
MKHSRRFRSLKIGRFALTLALPLCGALLAARPAAAVEAKAEEEVKVVKGSKSLTPAMKKVEAAAPALKAESVVRSVDLAKASTLREEAFKGLIELIKETEVSDPDRPELLFRLAEQYYDLSKAEGFRAREMDDIVADCDAKRVTGPKCSGVHEKRDGFEKNATKYRTEAFKAYVEIVKSKPDWKDIDKVLFSIGYTLHELGKEEQARDFYKKLIKEHPDSPYVPDALLSFAEYYFYEGDMDTSLRAYIKVSAYKDSRVYGFSLYKQAWCYYNLGDFEESIKKFIEVISYSAAEAAKGAKDKISLAKEAKRDMVLAYSHVGTPGKALAFFKKYGGDADGNWMLARLADIYYDQGKFKEAIATYRQVIALDPDSDGNHNLQFKILQCAMAIGDKKEIVKEMHRLSELLAVMETKSKDKAKVDEARRTTADVLREIATTWHREAQVTKNKDTYALAMYVYKDYIDHFPKEKDIYIMTYYYADLLYKLEKWEECAEYFLKVLSIDSKGKYTEEAAKAAVLSYRNLKKIDEAKHVTTAIVVEDDKDKGKKKKTRADYPPKPLSELDKKVLAAYEIYMKYLPKGEKIVEVWYDYARTYYDYNEFDKAQPYFEKIVNERSDHYLAPYAGNLLLDILNLKEDYKSMKMYVDRFVKDPKMTEKDPEFAKIIQEIYEWNKFQYCGEFVKKEDWGPAGLCFHNFTEEFPSSTRMYEGIYNAAVGYEKAKKVGLAIKMREKLAETFPDKEYGEASLFVVAQLYMDLAVYSKVAEKFVDFATKHPHHKDACGALSNAALFMEGLGEYDKAIDLNKKYIAACPKDKKEAALRFFRNAKILEKKGDMKAALKVYDEYIKKFGKTWSLDDYFDARLHMVKDKIGTKMDAKDYKLYEGIKDEFDKLPKDFVEKAVAAGSLGPTGRDAVGEAAFLISEPIFTEFLSVKLPADVDPDPEKLKKGLAKWLEEKSALLEKTRAVYGNVILYQSLDWALAALCRIGQIYNNFKTQLFEAPTPELVTYELDMSKFKGIPKGMLVKALKEAGLKDKIVKIDAKGVAHMEHKMNDDDKDAYKAGLEEIAFPLEAKAIDGFNVCLATAKEKEWFNDWSKLCEEMLNKIEPAKYPLTAEIFPPAKRHAVEVVLARPVTTVAE